MSSGQRRGGIAGRSSDVLLVAGVILLSGGIAWRAGWIGDAWRGLYPHLPSRVQGIPYRLRAALPGAQATPVALPPVATAPWPVQARGAVGSETSGGGAAAGATILAEPVGTSEATLRSPDAGTTPSAPTPSPSVPPPPASTPPTARLTLDLPAAAALTQLRHSYQTWNNCGPATVVMALSAWRIEGDQARAATRLKPDPDDKNVAPGELARYVGERGLEARVLHGGSLDVLRRLVAAGIPVILETWFEPDPGDEMGHYRVLVGYADDGATMQFHDPYLGPDLALSAEAVDADWRAFNRLYVPVYPPERRADVRRAVGRAFDEPQVMWTLAAATAQAEATLLDDAFAHFNLGTSLAGLDDAEAAAAAFDRARQRGLPWRMLWYQQAPFAVYAARERWADVEALAEANLRNAPNLEESLLWRAAARDDAGEREGAEADLRRALRLNPLYAPAADALSALESGDSVVQAVLASRAGWPDGAWRPAAETP